MDHHGHSTRDRPTSGSPRTQSGTDAGHLRARTIPPGPIPAWMAVRSTPDSGPRLECHELGGTGSDNLHAARKNQGSRVATLVLGLASESSGKPCVPRSCHRLPRLSKALFVRKATRAWASTQIQSVDRMDSRCATGICMIRSGSPLLLESGFGPAHPAQSIQVLSL